MHVESRMCEYISNVYIHNVVNYHLKNETLLDVIR